MKQAGPEAESQISYNTPPRWLIALLAERFFVACDQLHDLKFLKKRHEKNSFCLDCICGICQHCLSIHSSHHVLQIRRYVYHNVIRLRDIQKLFDCSRVQTYVINSAKVVFLNKRPQPKSSKTLSNTCQLCERSLQDAYRFCSVACKVGTVFNDQLLKISFEREQADRKKRQCSGTESRSSSEVGLSEVYNSVSRGVDRRVSSHYNFQCNGENGEEQQCSYMSECSSATEEYGLSCWERYEAIYSPMCQQTADQQYSLHCRRWQQPISDNALGCNFSKHAVNSFRYKCISPHSMFIPTSLSRRKHRPHRSPLS
ncbi:hypothetical protein L7F22_026259 [Adiantum nelumboides]|nr:hypothetical protein [Adiantum nelumboides]